MDVQDFVEERTGELIRVLDSYLLKQLQHAEIQRYVASVFSDWDCECVTRDEPMAAGEREFWCAMWAIQHLSSDDHWVDGVTQRELGFLLRVLKGEEPLPASFVGCRP